MDLEEIRCRLRGINLQPGIFPPGKINAITDVPRPFQPSII
jgi:hypothetical protein